MSMLSSANPASHGTLDFTIVPVAAACSLGTSVLVAMGFYLAEGDNPGAVVMFTFLTAPLSAGSALLAFPVASRLSEKLGRWFMPLMCSLGIFTGVVYMFALSLLVGPDLLALQLSLGPFWMAASSTAFFIVAWKARGGNLLRGAGLAALLCGSLTVGFTSAGPFIATHILKSTRLIVMGIQYVPGSEPLTWKTDSHPRQTILLSGAEIAEEGRWKVAISKQLAPQLKTGTLDLTRIEAIGNDGPLSFVAFVMTHDVSQSVTFRQPFGSMVIYLQQDNGWRQLPPDARTMSRTIRLFRMDGYIGTSYEVEDFEGGSRGGGIELCPC